MGFRNWLEMSTIRDLLTGVPQNPKYHPEGDVWTHVRLVRKSLPAAVQMFEQARAQEGSPFSNFTPVSKQDEDILRLAAWLHDIGKNTATAYTNPDKSRTPWTNQNFQGYSVQQMMSPDFGPGKWQSIGHEEPTHYQPLVKQLGHQWQVMLEKLSPEDKDTLWFVVDRHMDFNEQGITRKMRQMTIGEDGKFLPDRKYKLWIIFKMMDSMGKGGGVDLASGEALLSKIITAALEKKQSKERQSQQQAQPDPEVLRAQLKQKGLTDRKIAEIIALKFGRN